MRARRDPWRWRWRLGVGLAVAAWPVVASPGARTFDAASEARLGGAMFAGRIPLRGRIREHVAVLPAAVVACVNCHGVATAARPDAGAPLVAPRLDRARLLEPLPRRGGPPSAYDPASFCRLLRTGVDPAFVLVAREMPSYDLADGQCAALWRYLTAGDGGAGGHAR